MTTNQENILQRAADVLYALAIKQKGPVLERRCNELAARIEAIIEQVD